MEVDALTPAPAAPNVTTEGAAGALEASADVFNAVGLPILPPPFGVVYGNTAPWKRSEGLRPPTPGRQRPTLSAVHLVSGATILVVPAGGGVPAVFAGPAILGLAPGDDIDALSLSENGTGVYEPSRAFYDWAGGATDMLFFSLRRGSPTIGTIRDSNYGMFIEEDDVLAPPLGGAGAPAIFIPAEALGLQTVRGGFPAPSDDLDALSIF